MLLVLSIDDVPSIDQPCGLTIGSFDGVHLGHQTLLKQLRAKLPSNGILVVYTFSNHPSHHFTPNAPTPLICPPLQKAKLLEEYGADIVILVPFTQQFANTPYEQFLRHLKEKLSFSHLMLGTNATFGHKRQGNEENVKKIAPSLEFEVNYLPKLALHETPISSGFIRSLIARGAFHETQECLGRPYSLMGHLTSDQRLYTFPTHGLCLPPEGVYPVRIKTSSQMHLGRAQVTSQEQKIHLELLKENVSIGEKEVEVIFA